MKNNIAYTLGTLELMTVKELRIVATEYQIKGRHDMTKANLINSILECQESEENGMETENNNNAVENNVESVENETETGIKVIYQPRKQKEGTRTRESYINAVEVGMIVVFSLSEEKALSAKVKHISRDNNNNVTKVLCEAKNGTGFEVSANKIMWIKTGKRYPKSIYEKLKGISSEKENNDPEE